MVPKMFLITDQPIELFSALDQEGDGEFGAVASFTGIVRGRSGGRNVRALQYEAYQPMALRSFERIAEEVKERWGVQHLAIIHRVGTLAPGEIAVAVSAAAAHRQEALAACSYAIDRVKEISPIWKKEFFEGEEAVWVACEAGHAEVKNVQPH